MARSRTTLALEVMDDLLLSVSVAGTTDGGVLGNEDIDRLMASLRSEKVRIYMAGFIGSAGSTAVQRKEGAELIRSRSIPVAVVTDDRIVRGFVTAVSWIGANVSAFSWSKSNNALAFLAVAEERRASITQAFNRMRDQLVAD